MIHLDNNLYGDNSCWYDTAQTALGIENTTKLRFLLIAMREGQLPYDAMERLEEFEKHLYVLQILSFRSKDEDFKRLFFQLVFEGLHNVV